MLSRRALVLVNLAACAWLAACAADPVPLPGDKPLSPSLQSRLDETLRRVQNSQGEARVGYLRTLSGFGRYATPSVIEQLLRSERPQLRADAVFVLGEINRLEGDADALAAVREAMNDTHRVVRLEAARALLEAGDLRGVGDLIVALDDPDGRTRATAFDALKRAAGGMDYGYSPAANPAERNAAMERFRAHFSLPQDGRP
ncbi:MAG: HEAT repeat domain-containing protein [Planctomycetes bacterium]|nr:HEAT repeat domain-containing protein [Planctomycetota bacterium]